LTSRKLIFPGWPQSCPESHESHDFGIKLYPDLSHHDLRWWHCWFQGWI